MYSAVLEADESNKESDKLKHWKEEQKVRIAKKDAEEELKKKEWRDSAKKELDDWYKQRAEQLVKVHANHRLVEEQNNAENKTPGREWERVGNMCDFNPKSNKGSKDLSRMRNILINLKQQPLNR